MTKDTKLKLVLTFVCVLLFAASQWLVGKFLLNDEETGRRIALFAILAFFLGFLTWYTMQGAWKARNTPRMPQPPPPRRPEPPGGWVSGWKDREQ